MKQAALFLTNEIYLDKSKNEGGVRVCTEEYLSLIQELYNVEIFKVCYHISYSYRFKVKFGLNAYDDYKPEDYIASLELVIREKNIQVVFLNLSNTAPFGKVIKSVFGNKVKVILCSHGNESGDFLHRSTRFQTKNSRILNFISSTTLGTMLKKETIFRQNNLDAILTVSPVEEALEKWIGAKHVLMIPRTVEKKYLTRKPLAGRVGFIGDLSHDPNFYGITELCKSIDQLQDKELLNIRLVGSPESIGEMFAKRYAFVTYLGYMNSEELQKESATWVYFLNPVFYYSRGVSTKLAKAFGWGIPVITSRLGCRGYVWKQEEPIYAETPTEMALAIQEYATDSEKFLAAEGNIRKLIDTIPTKEKNAKILAEFISIIS
jgi:hypothetical protein